MFSLSKHRILKEHLAFRQGSFPDCHWRFKDSSLTFLSDCVREILNDTGDPSVEGLEILKLARRKGVYRVVDPDDRNRSFIVKMFFLRHLSHRLSAHLYGLDEAANLVTAASRGVKTPELLGFGQFYARSGLIKVAAVVMEDLKGYSTVYDFLKKHDDSHHKEILTRVVPVFKSLYLGGCNHIDVNGASIMLSDDKSNSDVFLLDFQHAIFYDKPNLNILMFEAGFFAATCLEWVSTETLYSWVNDVLADIGVKDPDEVRKAIEFFDFYFQAKWRTPSMKKLSRKERKGMH